MPKHKEFKFLSTLPNLKLKPPIFIRLATSNEILLYSIIFIFFIEVESSTNSENLSESHDF